MMKESLSLAKLAVILIIGFSFIVACRPDPTINTDGDGDGDSDGDSDGDGDGDADADIQPPDPNQDLDGDGFTPNTGDCDEYEALINPNAFEVADNGRDDDCDDAVDEAPEECDCAGGATLPAGLDLCDPRFLLSFDRVFHIETATLGAGVRNRYGTGGNDLAPQRGCAYTILATGPVDIADCDPFDCPDGKRQYGTDFYYRYDPWMFCDEFNSEPDPDPDGADGAIICDTNQLVLHLRAPANANGFTFDFLYLSTEYPEYVDLGFNDTFYAIIDRPTTGERINISFDEQESEIEIDNAFFEDPPTTNIDGTGYDGMCNDDFGYNLCGSSTGWLRTQWSINPGEEFTLTFSIHDEGDGVLDSGVIIDNFAWSNEPVDDGTDVLY